ncbi:MAG TPA: hypothetical protein PLQ89_14250 [Phycisphaerae bacterium]|nr:hypothetical protein [Phycisphaerae bacterium]
MLRTGLTNLTRFGGTTPEQTMGTVLRGTRVNRLNVFKQLGEGWYTVNPIAARQPEVQQAVRALNNPGSQKAMPPRPGNNGEAERYKARIAELERQLKQALEEKNALEKRLHQIVTIAVGRAG